MIEFLDREEERARIIRLLNSPEGSLCCLYGRRRCGKTRLLRECTKGRPNVLYHVADKSDRPAQIARFVKEAESINPAFRVAAGADWGAVLDLWMSLSPAGSVLVLDEFPYLVERDEALPSVLQRIVDVIPQTGKKIIICGSSQRMMQGFVLKASEPLYGRAREILPIAPLRFEWLKRAFPRLSSWDRLMLWSVWGGVPRYWELQDGEQDLWSAVYRNVCSPLGILRNEPQFLLLDDVGDTAQASTVLSFIGGGAHRASEIAARMSRPMTDMSRPLQRLAELGLVTKDVPFGAEPNGKRSLYRISDQFLDFWYTFVQPNWSSPDFLERPSDRRVFSREYLPYLGGVWERLVRMEISQRAIPGLDCRLCKAARWWGTGRNMRPMELDIVAESADGETLFVGEAKLKLSEVECAHVKVELEAKAANLPFADKYRRVVTGLFVAKDPPPVALSLEWCE